MEETAKKRILSGIQPSGMITLGNYIGALRNWVELQNEYECFFMLADLHTITVRQKPADLRSHTLQLMSLYLACGIDPEKSLIFIQSHVPQHAELAWILNCYTQMGELSRMTQFKDKSARHEGNVNAGLFTYPVLMAADILLYQSDLVPVGTDQKQHLEICRTIGARFNGIYGDVFKLPEGYIPKMGAKIMSLQNPAAKMSKSDENVNGFISLVDDRDTIIRKFKRAVTDSESVVKFADGKDGINNLITIYCSITGKTVEQTEKEFENAGYGDFKLAVGETVADHLAPIQQKYAQYMADKPYLESIYKKGGEIAEKVSMRTLAKVYKKVGFVK